jgi:aspartate aminotransferase
MKFSTRAKNMEASATLAISGKAKAMKREGKPVISFGAGEPDFTSPKAALDAAKDAIDRGETHYTPATGIPELKEEVAKYYERRFGLKYKFNKEVIIGSGAKPLIYETLGCLVDPGDEVLVFAPAWVSYVEQIKLCDGKPVIIDTTKSGFLPDPSAIEASITPNTKGMLINTPSNPVGVVYPEDGLSKIADIAIKHDLWIIYDEIYERLVYDGQEHINIVSLRPELRDRTILINGASKAFAMTGWRIGYALGPEEAMGKIGDFQGHLTSNPSSIAQWAAVGALRGADEDVKRMHGAFDERRRKMISLLKEIPGISFVEPKGAFYVFVDIRNCLDKTYEGKIIDSDIKFCELALENKYIAIVPGSAFLTSGFVRFSYANSMEEIEEGIKRFKEMVEALK